MAALEGGQMSFVSTAPERLGYFDIQLNHPSWEDAKVLDFGGNRGTLLSSGRIRESNYWCIDVSRDAIEQGRREYPDAHWIFYDRYNFHFNPGGIAGHPIPLRERMFDYIVAYSVFTHVSKSEMLEHVASLRDLLLENGRLAFTFIDPHHILPRSYNSLLQKHDPPTNLGLRLEKIRQNNPLLPVQQRLRQAAGSEWCTLINNGDLYLGSEDSVSHCTETKFLYDSFCTADYMARIFPEATIFPPPAIYAEGAEMQHCCILKAKVEPES
jgi:SAM-dependent methyltransferase